MLENSKDKRDIISRLISLIIFLAIIILTLYTTLHDILRALGIESDRLKISLATYSRNWAIVITLVILLLLHFYYYDANVKKLYKKLPPKIQFLLASAFIGISSGYVIYLVFFLLISMDDFTYFLNLLGLFLFAAVTFNILTSAIMYGFLNRINQLIKHDFGELIVPISLVAGCLLSLFFSLIVTLALAPQ
jgi:hypothetical protein